MGSCAPVGSDLWYRYTATSAADITVSTCGSSYDTVLEAFSGSCGNLATSEACNDDFCGLQSEITFAPISGATYFIRVGGFDSNVGSGQIVLTQEGPLGAGSWVHELLHGQPEHFGSGFHSIWARCPLRAGCRALRNPAQAHNDVLLTAERLPMNSFGFFVVSLDQGFSPLANGSSDGNLCLGGTIGRYSAPMNVGNSGASGTFSLRIDLTEIPQGGPTLSVQPGQSLNFQAWHRDSSARGSNFTNGLEITFL